MTAAISTHVLDTGTGRPASGVRVALWKGGVCLGVATTGADGRIRALGRGLEPGLYRLVFELTSPFFKSVTLEVEISEGDHHVPLLISPYGIASYRGS